jgi:hypothetical protein
MTLSKRQINDSASSKRIPTVSCSCGPTAVNDAKSVQNRKILNIPSRPCLDCAAAIFAMTVNRMPVVVTIQIVANTLLPIPAEHKAKIEIETAVELVSFRGASYRRPPSLVPRLLLLLLDILELDRLVPNKDTLKQEGKKPEGKIQFTVTGMKTRYDERERGQNESRTFPRYGSGFLHRLILAANNPNFCLSVPWSTILVG